MTASSTRSSSSAGLSPPASATSIRLGKLWLGQDGVVRLVVDDLDAIGLDDAKEYLRAFVTIAAGRKRPVLCDIRRLKVSADRDARQYFSGSELTQHVAAAAFLVQSPLTRMIVNFFLRVNKPEFPARMFSDEHEILRWLRDFLP